MVQHLANDEPWHTCRRRGAGRRTTEGVTAKIRDRQPRDGFRLVTLPTRASEHVVVLGSCRLLQRSQHREGGGREQDTSGNPFLLCSAGIVHHPVSRSASAHRMFRTSPPRCAVIRHRREKPPPSWERRPQRPDLISGQHPVPAMPTLGLGTSVIGVASTMYCSTANTNIVCRKGGDGVPRPAHHGRPSPWTSALASRRWTSCAAR